MAKKLLTPCRNEDKASSASFFDLLITIIRTGWRGYKSNCQRMFCKGAVHAARGPREYYTGFVNRVQALSDQACVPV